MPATSQPAEWAANYIGIPYLSRGRTREGLDCWGLFRLIYQEQFGIDLPSFADDIAYEDRSDIYEIGEFINVNMDPDEWLEVTDRASVEVGDGLLCTLSGRPIHTAVLVSNQHMIHIQDMERAGRQIGASTMERFSGLIWDQRILGIYRHVTRW